MTLSVSHIEDYTMYRLYNLSFNSQSISNFAFYVPSKY